MTGKARDLGLELRHPILDAFPQVVWTATPDGSTKYLSRRGLELIGIAPEQVMGWNWLDLLHPDDVERSRQRWNEAVNAGAEYVNEYRLRQPDGSYRWYLAHALPLPHTDEGPSGWLGTWTDIDDRRRAEERHERDALLLANVRECIIVTDPAGIVTYWNDAATATYGWTAAEMVGRPLADRFPEEARPLIAEMMGSIAAGHDWHGEFEDYHRNGSRIWINARVSRISNASGELIGIIGTSHDITARKRAEEERDRVATRLRLQVDRMPLAYVLFDRDLRIIDWNAAAEQMFGYTRNEALNMMSPVDTLLPPSERPAATEVLRRLRAGDMAAHAINDNATRDGRRITCEWWNTPLLDSQGAFAGLISLAQDITERRRADEALRASEERFRQIADSISEVFWLTTPDMQSVDYVSPGYDAIWGRAREALYASPQSWMDAIHVDDRPRVARVVATSHLTKGYDEEYRIVRPDGTERWIRDRAFPVLDGSGTVIRVAGVAEDITAKKQSEEQLRATTEQLRARSVSLAEAREEEGRRIARELHDELGGSLSAIKWDLERLAAGLDQTSVPDPSGLRQRLDLLAGTVREAGETVRRIASELRPPMLDDLGLVDAIEWQATEFERRTGIRCQIARSGAAAPLPPSITIAIFRIFQEALTNILRHARASLVEIGVMADTSTFALTVRDDGIGLPPRDDARRGLGIVGMYERAALIGADLDVTSHPDRGTVIRLQAPLRDEGAEPA